jgi:pimeloyl-ACP methyl ester carboxylesterase
MSFTQSLPSDPAAQSRQARVGAIPVHYVEQGSGVPLLALHGWAVDHRGMTGALEPLFADRRGYRRIYPDLPGMGRTPAPPTINSSDDMVDVVLGLIDHVIGDEPFLLIGQSHGGYLARAIANRRPDQVAGLALICSDDPGGPVRDVPEHVVLHAFGDLGGILDPALEAEYRGYFVVQTPETLRRFQEDEGPGIALAVKPSLERIAERFALRQRPEEAPPYANPTLIVTGRQDAFVGYAAAWTWLDHYPRATFAVLDRAGHALPHEQTALLNALIAEWLDRVREHRPT